MSERTTGQVQDMPRPSLSTLMKRPFKERDEGVIDDAIGVITTLSFFALPQSRVHRPTTRISLICLENAEGRLEEALSAPKRYSNERKLLFTQRCCVA
ncbi:hypothetical protein ALC60_02457 [Trachymyrmex zeteki]|uniref:Uncharacterized protein n=1 Tax=Mycetomoellerius zeteki TaxID=64791 RepID=A0A151XEL0_9HYME|nr:hypothetical protein ALC60_02457 [Trachymyrmex zeteki]